MYLWEWIFGSVDEGRGNVILDQADLLDMGAHTMDSGMGSIEGWVG